MQDRMAFFSTATELFAMTFKAKSAKSTITHYWHLGGQNKIC